MDNGLPGKDVDVGTFERLINKHNARKVAWKKAHEAPKDEAIWFETTNFGWLYSSVVEGQGRKLIARC